MPLPTNRIKYTLHSPSAGDRVVTPTGESSFKITYELHNEDGDPLYDYIIKVAGNFNFAGEDYQWIKAIEDDPLVRGEEILLEMEHLDTGEILADGSKIILNDGVFDLDRCCVDIPVTTPDHYEVFNGAKDDELNMFDLMESGPFYDVHCLGYTPKFELNYSPFDGPALGFDIDHQDFHYYPNSRAEYPGYSVDGQKPQEYKLYYPNAAVKLFDSIDLMELTPNADGIANINIGSKPYHNGYGDPADALADGWRLYSFWWNGYHGDITGIFDYNCRFVWLREIKDVVIGTTMDPEWIYIGVVSGTLHDTDSGLERWARSPILVPRTNTTRAAFRTEASPDVVQTEMQQTSFCVGLVYSNVFITAGTYPDTTTVAPIESIPSPFPRVDWKNYYGFESLNNGKPFNDLIEWAIGKCDPSLTVKSDFLQINPTVVSSDNYVTGLPSFVDDIMIFQKSDVKRPFATNKATRGMFTPNKMLTWLLEMFNMRYRIEGSVFILEHVSSPYFVKPATRDLTAPPLNERLAGLRRYSYDKKEKLPAKETFKFMEGRPQGDGEPLDDFNGLPILYYGSNVDRTKDAGVLEHAVDGVTTDVYHILIHSGGVGYLIDAVTKNPYPVQNASDDNTISDDGFVLVASNLVTIGVTSTRYMFIENPILDDDRQMNNVLGWAFLHRDFFKTNRNTKRGELNGTPVTFDSTKYIKQSVELNFDMCNINEFDPFELIVSALGTGIVKTAEFTISDQTITVVLGYQE